MNKEIVREKAIRRNAKVKKIKRRRRLGIFVLLLLIVLMITGVASLYNSNFFNVKEVVITGNHHIPEKEIVKQSGIDSNISLLKLPLDEVKIKILKNPWIKDAEITRHFPNSVEIKVVERKAIAALPFQDIYLLIDKDAVVLESREFIEDLNLPIILDIRLIKAKIGEKINLVNLKNAMKCLVSLDKNLRESVTMVNAPSEEKLTLMLSLKDDDKSFHDVEILYGKAEGVLTKNAIIKKILEESEKHVIYIDVRVASNPAVKFLDDIS